MFGYYPAFHTLTSVGRKSTFSMLEICFRFSLLQLEVIKEMEGCCEKRVER